MTTSETTHAVKPYDTVIIIDSNFDIKELRETLKAQDVYDDEKGNENTCSDESASKRSYMSADSSVSNSLCGEAVSRVCHLSDDVISARNDRCSVGCALLSYVTGFILWIILCCLLSQVKFTATPPRLHDLQGHTEINDSTTDRVKRSDNAERQSEFPAVIICNKNQLMKSATNEMMEEVITTLFDDQDESVNNLTRSILSEVPDFDSIGWLWFYAMSQHKLDTMFVKCTFGGVACGLEDFTPMLTDSGMCYVFNAGRETREIAQLTGLSTLTGQLNTSEQATLAGKEISKLEIWLTVQQEEYVMYLRDSHSAGFYVDYQDKDRPSPLLRKHTTVGVGETIVDLHRNSDIHKSSKRSAKKHNDCVKSRHMDVCGCNWFYDWMPGPNMTICDPLMTKTCLMKHNNDFNGECNAQIAREDNSIPSASDFEVVSSETSPVSMMTLRSIGDNWQNLNHGDTPPSESDNWKIAMGLPLDPYFYWEKNLVILSVSMAMAETTPTLFDTPVATQARQLPSTTETTPVQNTQNSMTSFIGSSYLPLTGSNLLSNNDSTVIKTVMIMSTLVFCTGLTVIKACRICVRLIRKFSLWVCGG